MAGPGAVFPLVLGLVFFPSTGCAFQVYVPTSSKAELGTNVFIPCTFKECSSGITQQYLAIVWEFEGNVIVRYDSKGIQKQPRKYIDEKNIKDGAADLYINNASIGDIGTYKCTVICSPERSHKEVNLTVYARPTISALDKMTVGNEQDKILCSVIGFYPVQITVELIKDGAVMSGSVLSSPQRNGDKTFSINSSVILPSAEKPKSLSCRVRHESLTEPLLQDIQLVYKDSGSDNIGLVVGVIAGAVIVVSVIAAVLYKRRSGSSDVLVNKIHGTKMMDGENGSLYCTACNCSQETQVQWIIQHKDGTTCDITEKNSGDTEEGQPLMSMEYKVSTEKVPSQKRKSCYDITTTLSFIPSVSRHLGSTVTCRFTTNKKSEEATHKLKDIYAKPQFMESLRFSITDQGDVQLSASLLRFYPQPLQISWTSKRGQSQDKIPSDEEDMKNPDATFTLTSKCTVSGELFKDPMNKVTVTWKHESMDNPQFKEISAKDLPWCPRIGDSIERVIQGDTILFKSLVSDYFPDALTVKWFQKKKDCPEFIEVTESEMYIIPNIVSSRTGKKTFTTTSCLSLKKSLLTEDDVMFICRVDHPSLEKPMEAKTGQQRDTEVQAFFVNNIQGPQRWYDGEKVTLYCAASYCTQNTRVIWIVTGKDGTENEICEDSGGADMKKDGGQCPGYVAHRERTDVSDIQDLLDVTSCLTFTPSVSKHKPITISCRVTCEGRVKKKTFQRKQLYAKPKVRSPIKLSLTNSDEIRWHFSENPMLAKTVKNADGTYSAHSEYKLPGSVFKDPQSWVKVSWKHESMDGWEWRQMSAVDKGKGVTSLVCSDQ
ncbi:hypothetical protein GDO78_016571 [Eleutherodactylus coqui]|uniref:Ig-like domain-containing protein n=1 Tax=Eleutherodactylus coqui TaxID=57060 RepID=A0A8J6EKP6_ELECQ|nr:hypothetical protein GDO78_016571 [Eleutherodactylus coqui]